MSNTTEVFIALGSNLENPLQQVTSGVDALARIPQTELIAQSAWYQSTAVGPGDQPDYINGVALLSTALSATELFHHIQLIETDHGRERRVRWAARTLDLDVLLYGDQIIESEQLQIPHPRLTERNFVLYPLADIRPDLILPNGTPIRSLLAACSTDGLKKL